MKAKMKNPTGKTKLPAGFAIIVSGSGDSVEWKKGMVITGVVLEIKTIDRKEVKKGEKKTTRLMRIETKDGEKTVWEKAALSNLFNKAKRGKVVYIQHQGMGKAKKGQSAPHLFVAGIK